MSPTLQTIEIAKPRSSNVFRHLTLRVPFEDLDSRAQDQPFSNDCVRCNRKFTRDSDRISQNLAETMEWIKHSAREGRQKSGMGGG